MFPFFCYFRVREKNSQESEHINVAESLPDNRVLQQPNGVQSVYLGKRVRANLAEKTARLKC